MAPERPCPVWPSSLAGSLGLWARGGEENGSCGQMPDERKPRAVSSRASVRVCADARVVNRTRDLNPSEPEPGAESSGDSGSISSSSRDWSFSLRKSGMVSSVELPAWYVQGRCCLCVCVCVVRIRTRSNLGCALPERICLALLCRLWMMMTTMMTMTMMMIMMVGSRTPRTGTY